MALLFADGFEDGLAGWVVAQSPATIGAGRFGNGVAVSGIGMIVTGVAPAATTVIAGVAFKPASGASAGGFMAFRHSSGGGFSHVGLNWGIGGEISAYRGNGTPIAGGSSPPGVVPAGAWSYVECKATIHATTGSVVVWANGLEVLNLTNVNTTSSGTASVNEVTLGYVGGIAAAAGSLDDFYLCDTTGIVNNNFLGELTVEHLRPAADEATQWLGSDGDSSNNFQLVDEAGTYSGTDYVASSTVGQRDLYVPGVSARPITSPVFGVVVAAVAQKTDAGVRTVKLDVKEGSGGTVRQSAELGLPTTFGELRAVFERKGDGSQFTMADVNALRMGVEVVT